IACALVLALLTGMIGLWYGYVTALREVEDAGSTVYFTSISSADLRRQRGDIEGAREALNQCLPMPDQSDHRAWEWVYLESLCRAGERGGGSAPSAGERRLGRDRDNGVGLFEFARSGNDIIALSDRDGKARRLDLTGRTTREIWLPLGVPARDPGHKEAIAAY